MRFVSLGCTVVIAIALVAACSDDTRTQDPGLGEAGSTSDLGGNAGATAEPVAGAGATAEAGAGGAPQSAAGSSAGGDNEPSGAGQAAGGAGVEPRTLPCEESMRADLMLNGGKVNEGAVTDEASEGGYLSRVDASSGGPANAPTNAWLYAKFTRSGLQKVEIDDEQALTSLDWDVAAKRYEVRLNGGDGGPSYVTAAALPDSAYEDVSEAPPASGFESERFYDDECVLQTSASGLGGPRLRLEGYFEYANCAIMTQTPFVLTLPSGEHVKLEVVAYYGSGQDVCDASGQGGSLPGQFTWRWQYLP